MTKFQIKHFVSHIHLFMESLHLIDTSKSNLVAVSGGLDSIALMYVLHDIFKGNLRVLHINHGTRAENILEQNLVLEHGQRLGLEVDVVKFTMNLDQANFEAVARNLRAKVYKQYIQKNFLVHTAHHLDDSFEWSMIQSFKQSSLSSTLGIPVFNRGLVRPFMSVSKNQIRLYARALGLSWAEDSSNRDTRFERNFFRANLTNIIHERYPQYLRHYVAHHNSLAMKLGMHRSLTLEKESSVHKVVGIREKREASGAVVLKSRDLRFHKDLIKEWIHFFSKTHRGEIDREVDKLIVAHTKIANDPRELKMKGPLSFSGGVKIYILKDYLLITNDLHMDYYRTSDERLLRLLQEMEPGTQITERLLTDKSKVFFPYLCLLSAKDRSKSSKLIHPLLPKSTKWLREHKIPYSFYPLLKKKGAQKLFHTAVILDSSVLGL